MSSGRISAYVFLLPQDIALIRGPRRRCGSSVRGGAPSATRALQ